MKKFFLSLMIALIIPLLKVNTVTAADPAERAVADPRVLDFVLSDPFLSKLFDAPNPAASYHFPAPAIPADLLNQDELPPEGAEAEASDSDEEPQESSQNTPGFLCETCGKVLPAQGLYRKHCKKAHGTKAYTYVCSECKKPFKSPNGLTQHLRKHTGERPFVCDPCKKSFAQKSCLSVHIRTHTGEQPFECAYCDSKFRRKPQLQKHSQSCTGLLAALASTLDPQ